LRYALPEQGVDYEFEPADFIQVNAGLNQAMVAQALEQLQPQPGEAILDLYCGLGNFSLPIARRGARVVGVEGSPELVGRARGNALRQGLEMEFHAADLSIDASAAPWAQESWDKILLDPPRAGAAAVFEYLPGASVRRVVYVSCHPGSLARDAGVLVRKHGFKLSAAGVMDMFPHTAHVESMAVFDRS
jgi:23S rRNA (uracil1939-C5)-methyltransferase